MSELLQPWLGETLLAAGAVLLLGLARWKTDAMRAVDVALLAIAASAVAAVASMDAPVALAAGGLLAVDPFASFFKLVLSMSGLAVVWLATRGNDASGRAGAEPIEERPIPWALFLLCLLATELVVSSVHLVSAWVALEVSTIAGALWVALRRAESSFASTTLLLLLEGAVASALVLLGFAMLYGLAGTLALDELAGRLTVALAAPGGRAVILAAVVLVLGGAAWRIAIVPWERSRVELVASAPASVAAWLLAGPAIAALALLVRVLRSAVSSPASDGHWAVLAGIEWPELLSIAAMVTMVLGNVAALREHSLRRLVAWLTVAQAGYLAIGFVVLRDEAIEAMLFHAVVYTLTVFGMLAALAPVTEQAGSDDFEVLRGLARRRGSAKPAAAAIALFVMSLSAIWPLAGCTGRSLLLTLLIKSGGTGLAAVATAASGIGLLILIRIVATLLDRPHDADENVTLDFEAVTLVAIALAATVGFGIWPGPLLAFAGHSVVFFGG